jgi:hypothetical protein
MVVRLVGRLLAAFTFLLLVVPGAASAASLEDPFNQWLPDSDAASWTYEWTDSEYAQTPTKEQYTVTGRQGASFRLAWTTDGLGNPDDAQSTNGTVDYQRTAAGMVVTNWAASQPPQQFPILCASAAQCGNSLAGVHFMLIWGTRSPLLAEPLVTGTAWSTTGGANNDVSSANRYVGTELVKVPAFPNGVVAAKVQSELTQAGALGDPYGSGVRTVWWVWGVGPVKVGFRHSGGAVQEANLVSTNLVPRPAPDDGNYLPLTTGKSQDFRWRNTKHMKSWSRQRFTVAQVVNNTARVDVKNISGPIKVAGSYVLSSRLTGVTNVSTFTKAASKAKFPPLGPRSTPKASRRHFFTPFDLMTFGFNPILPAYPEKDQAWSSDRGSPDWKAFGVSGHSTVIGFRTIRVPAGKFKALGIQSTLSQKGFPFGTGRREAWFAAGKGLVKLVFSHRDGSVSTVERLR